MGGGPRFPQPGVCPTALWRVPLEAKQTIPLPFVRPGHPPRLVPTMTSKKYPVASFIHPHLNVQVPPHDLLPGTAVPLHSVTSLRWHWRGCQAVTSLRWH